MSCFVPFILQRYEIYSNFARDLVVFLHIHSPDSQLHRPIHSPAIIITEGDHDDA